MIEMVNGDARGIPLRDGTVQCVVTSPPYWGLRNYGVDGQIGLERTPEEYVANIVAVMLEVRRVLRNDGTVWLNLGDSYAGSGQGVMGNGTQVGGAKQRTNAGSVMGLFGTSRKAGNGLKPKDLVGIPWMVAFALRADGWYLRSEIIWHKPNPMPESVTDRPTKAHEQVFLLSKSSDYFYDAEAIKEKYTGPINRWGGQKQSSDTRKGRAYRDMQQVSPSSALQPGADLRPDPNGRNKRSVWTVATQSYSGAHFATFPEKLVEPCVLAGTSARGACPRCGAGWVRVVEPTGHVNQREDAHQPGNTPTKVDSTGWAPTSIATNDWLPRCNCEAGEPVPCLVLDPFAGTGTVGRVCAKHGRRFVGVELKREYIELARDKTSGVQMVMAETSSVAVMRLTR